MQALSKVNREGTYTVKWMFGGPEVLAFLRSCQIEEGSTIRVISRCLGGLIVGTATKRLFIGDEAADRIQV